MNSLFKLICVSFAGLLLTFAHTSFGGDHDKPVKGTSIHKEFVSSNPEGLIGITEESPIDNPVDNIFHVSVNELLCAEQKVWLVYELEGVQDHTSVSRSINDQVSVGGYLVKRRRGWATQKEEVNAAWLRQGDNIVRFTMPENAQHSYRIKNLRLEVESAQESNNEVKIIFNQPSKHYFFDKAYVKGFISGANYQNIKIKIGGKDARIFNGEFESIIDFEDAQNSCSADVEILYSDGTTTCDKVTFSEPQSIDFNYSLESYTYRSEKFFEAKKSETLSLHGATFTSTEGSLDANKIISITTLRSVDIPALDGGMVNVTKNSAGFRFLPHGTTFKKEAKVTIPFDPEKIPDGYTDKDIRTYYFDETAHHWIALSTDTVLLESSEVVAKTTHFTDFINGIIKVPESPEAEAYNSTSIKDIKAANPTAAINLINPPTANNTGSASLSYPIVVPTGRGGVAPQIAINYNSGSSNGWMGLGWNVTLPAVTIETRWGVPRFDPNKETETYALNGEQLTPLAHRGPLQNRYADGKQFFPRVEGSFSKIMRHGTSPGNYYWEVTDKTGTRYFYGGTKSGGFDKTAVLRDNEKGDQGNIALWGLRETVDLNGNNVHYYYVKIEDVGVKGGTVPGFQMYIDKITYTGHGGADGPYTVNFIRDRQLPNWTKRTDVQIMGNLGFKMVTADRLKKIEVQFDGKNIRSYEFNYNTGEFYKTLLENISEFDAKGVFFNKHSFTYYNEVKSGNSFVPYDPTKTWTVPSDGIDGGLIVSKAGFDDNASVMSGNKSTDFGFGMTVTAGFNDGNLTSKSMTLGGSFGYSQAETEGKLLMLDINGDGLPDKVMADDTGFRYRANESKQGGPERFSQNWYEIKNVGQFFKDKSKTTNVGFEAQGGYGNVSAFVGLGRSKTTSVTTVYFTDVNGDQLPDLVNNGLVYFNHYDRETGVVTFQLSSEGTPSPIDNSGGVAGDIFQIDQTDVDADIDANPLHDVVRMWRAPYTGTITITAPVKLVNTNQTIPNADGVNVTIQKNGNPPLWTKRIQATDFMEYTPSSVSNLSVNKGDRIYFRVQSVFNGEADIVQWSPQIKYEHKDMKRVNANGHAVYTFDTKKDFVLSAPMEIATPFAGKVKIEGTFIKPKTTDTVLVEVIRRNASGTMVEFSAKLSWNSDTTLAIDLEKVVAENESFIFKVTSNTNVNWPALQWQPHVYYTESYDSRVTELFRDGRPTISYQAVPKYSIFANAMRDSSVFAVYKDVSSISVSTNLKLRQWPHPIPDPASGDVIVSVKKRDSLIAKHKIRIVNGQFEQKTFDVSVTKNDTLYVEYHTSSETLAEALESYKASVKIDSEDTVFTANLYTVFEKKTDFIYGPLFRQWGFFAYNGNRDRANLPINENDLRLSSKLEREYREGDVSNPDQLSGSDPYDPSKENFVMLYARGADHAWAGHDEFTWLDAEKISSSRMGDDDITPAQALTPGGGNSVAVRAVNKITKSTSNSVSGGVGFEGVGNASGNTSNGSSRVLSDFMDMNGDRYPDIITERGIQFTQPTGKLENQYNPFVTGDVTSTITNSRGASAGGFVKIQPKGNSTNARATKSDVGGAKSSGVISINYGKGDNSGNFTWIDINGDGLPDRVHANGMAELNLGYKLAAAENWSNQGVQVSESESYGGGLGFSIGTGSESSSISGGVGLSRSDNEVNRILQDINGDGLNDQLVLDGGVKVKLNTGNGFVSTEMSWPGLSKINESSTTGESANLAFTGCIPLGVIPVKICINPSGNTGRSMSRDERKISDIDGDGFPDFLSSANDGDLHVNRSSIDRTNLLRSVSRPLGSTITMSYARIGNTYDMPNSIWAMDSVTVFDGFTGDGVDKALTTFKYEGGLFHRQERDFFGFKKVMINTHDTGKENKPVYTTLTQNFINENFYERGLMTSEVLTDGAGNKFVEKENKYQSKNIFTGADITITSTNDPGNAFTPLVETQQKFYEGESTPGKSTRETYGYDAKGNVVTYTDFADDGEEDNISAAITYHNLLDLYVIGSPKSILVNGSGTTYRKRESIIDPQSGDVIAVRQYLNDTDFSETTMEYDEFGNLKKISKPKNAKEQRMSFNYEYDNVTHSLTTKITNSYGYSSEATYDFRFGQVLTRKDINGNEVKYEIDDVGRITKITGPYEKGGYTLKFEYHPEATVPWALTRHFDPSDPKNDLLTVIFVDGSGRVIQTKKDIALFQGDGKADLEAMSVSGHAKFDAFGRTTTILYPTTEPAGTPEKFNTNEDNIKPSKTTHDILNRPLIVTLPDNSVTTTIYGFGIDKFGKKQFSTKTIDANDKQSEQFTNVKGKVTSIKTSTSDKDVWTSFKYNAVNEQIQATDDLGHTTFTAYDNFGRKISRKHPDAGTTTYSYDMVGNLVELVTANLAGKGLSVRYSHDFERLTEIAYPENPENNVKYTYGEAGASDNRAGKVVLQEDASGAQEFFYGPLGEVLKNVRTIVIPQHDEQTYVTEWKYDTWNRLISMVYPDGEQVDYTYNAAGTLRSMSGKKKNATFSYVNQVGYDKFEQRVFLAYGNGTKTTYNYEPDRRRLSNVAAMTKGGRLMMDNVYEYDKVNNIISLKNNAPIPSANLMGGQSEYTFEYDDMYRLTAAEGSFKGASDQHSYTLAMSYNTVGSILQKNQVHRRKDVQQKKTTYNLTYQYGDTQPHAPSHIGHNTYTYDANGNQTGWTDDASGQRRTVLWDEENRVRAIYDNGSLHHYVYDAAGERVLKAKSTGQRIFVNGEWKAGNGQMGNYTVYVNPYIVLKSGGYTKHYYVEGQRIVSKLGGGWDNNGKGPLKAGGSKVDYASRSQKVFDGIVKNLKFLGADGQILTAGKSGKVPPGQINGTGNVAESFRYFYHSDHLGSTSYVTDASGEVFQHLEYFAFGETFVEEHSNTDRIPYLFNGKELDDETGLYYYGARYYDPATSIWMSVDALADNFTGWSPYNYTFNNPLRFIDPDGNGPKPAPPLVEAAIKALNQNVYSAFYYANNTSNWHLNEWARGRAGADAENKVRGAVGEAAFYSKIEGARPAWAKGSMTNMLFFGGELYNKANFAFQVDVAQIVTTGRYNILGVNVHRTFGVVNYDANGNQRAMKMLESNSTKSWIINYEVKTLNPFASTASLYDNLVKGINQATTRGTSRGDGFLGVLVTDKAAWQKVANDPMYGPLLKAQFQKLEKSGNYLRLIDGFYSEVDNAVKILKSTIQTVPEN
jgi:RHS repeat-associated protein